MCDFGEQLAVQQNRAASRSGGALTQTVAVGGSAVAPTVARNGYTFNGWDMSFTEVSAFKDNVGILVAHILALVMAFTDRELATTVCLVADYATIYF